MYPRVTALIPTYRRPKFLKRAIMSVLGQTYENLQLCIFDNASGDNTEDIVAKLNENDERIRYHCHSTNIGAFNNWKHIFKNIDTPYFSVLSDDDFLAQDFYESAIKVLDDNPNIGFVIFNTLRVDEDTNLIGNIECSNELNFYNGRKGFDAIHSGNIPLTWTGMMFRKEVAKIYEEMQSDYDPGSDMRFIFRAASRYQYAHLSKVGAFFTVHSGSYSPIKSIDFVHQGVQISRYIEIFHDKKVSQEIKDRSIFYIKKLLFLKPYKQIIHFLVQILQNLIIFDEFKDKKIKENITDLEYVGYAKTSLLLNFVYKSKTVKIFVKLLFGKIYKRKINIKKLEMSSLQSGIYKKYFNNLKE